METLLLLQIFFTAITLLTVYLFYRASGKRKLVVLIVLLWMLAQAGLGLSGFYSDTSAFLPRVFFQVIPAFATIVFLFVNRKTRAWIDNADAGMLTLLHSIRIGVELVIYGLFTVKLMPEILTFEGRNFDIIAGLTAPVVYYFGYVRKVIGRTGLLIWNFGCLVLLFNIVIHAALSVPTPFQQFGFEQPNVAILQFPFNWLPSVVVPLVLFSQLIVIRRLFRKQNLV
ncbi:MAG: hypothetical protein ACK5Z2_03450 [Bacteroidota bacterium]|jgi:hypothetical protein